MKLSLSSQDVYQLEADVVAVPVFEGDSISGFGAADALVLRAAQEESFEGKRDQKLMVSLQGSIKRVLAIGMGKRANLTAYAWRSFAGHAIKAAQKVSARRVALQLSDAESVRFAAEGALLGSYQYNKYKSEPPKGAISDVVLCAAQGQASHLREAEIVAEGVLFARELINEPANILTPIELANRAEKMAKEVGLEAKILTEKECAELKMELLLAVGQGSVAGTRLVHLIYKPTNAKGKLAFVGKGITFDSGGLSLKPPKSMIGMQFDMSGSAAVFGAMYAIAQLKPDVEVHGIAPLTENMPSGTAYRPSDVFRAMSGKTVEVLNTDAEGRLVLADALWYATLLQPDAIVDLATLTGACLVALGNNIAGAFGSNEAFTQQVLQAAKNIGEECWHLPLPEAMKADLKGEVGDLRNVTGDPYGGAIIGALFLQEFTNNLPWVHLDIAGPAHAEKDSPITNKGGTGFGVMTLIELAKRFQKQ
jgi:leucyl aminopeptidase